jgi:hypothetical protein
VDFLLTEVEPVSRTLKETGTPSVADQIRLQTCCGFGSQAATFYASVNDWNRKQTNGVSDSEATAGGNSFVPISDDPQILTIMLSFAKVAAERRRKEAAEAAEAAKLNVVATPKAEDAEKEQAEKKEQDALKDEKREELSIALQAILDAAIGELRRRKQLLEVIEGEEAKTATSMTVIDEDLSERFARAETAVERRMYRALAALAAMRAVPVSSLLPS